MKPSNFQALMLLVGITLFSTVVAAQDGPLKICTAWTVQFVDSGYGEDAFNTTATTPVPAKWARAKVVRNSDGVQIWKGNLDDSGCTPTLSLGGYTTYTLTQWTIAERGTRRVFVNKSNVTTPSKAESNQCTTTRGFTTSYLQDLYNPPLNFASAQTYCSNAIVVAAEALRYFTTREYPDGTDTVISVNTGYCTCDGGTCWDPGTENICINRSYDVIDPNNPMDHSTYKFVIAHEMGHRLADVTGAPLAASGYNVLWQEETQHACNCLHTPTVGSCMQSRGYTGKAQKEGWAHFYAMALFNNRESVGAIAYWRSMYAPYLYPGGRSYTLDTTAPVSFSGGLAKYEAWMKDYCVSAAGYTWIDRGTNSDWISFFWRLWTNTGYYQFTVDEISNIWNATAQNANGGGAKWSDLKNTVIALWGVDSVQRDAFDNLGPLVGVNY